MTSARSGDGLSGDPVGDVGLAVGRVLAASHVVAAHHLPALFREHVAGFGGRDVTCYLADLQQTVLVPFLPDPAEPDAPGGALPPSAYASRQVPPPSGPTGPLEHTEPLAVDSTLAGRAFQLSTPLVGHRDATSSVVWLPLLDGSERLGVVAVVVDEVAPDETLLDRLRVFAALAAELVMTKTMYGDTLVRLRRTASMSFAAEMQWSVLPPLTFACDDVTVAAALEPAYEVAGDTVDYAVDRDVARVAVFDGMGHGLLSAQLATMTVTAYRHARRTGRGLVETCRQIDEVLSTSFAGATFSTAVLTELDTRTGYLRWVNAGHPEPLLLRHGQLVKTLHVAPRPPLGMLLPPGTPALAAMHDPAIGVEQLEPGDCVLLYTDGVVEARSPDGDFFGEQRLADVVVRNLAAGLPAPETMRRVVRTILEHQAGRLDDDASLAMIQWPTEVASVVPYPTGS